MNEKRPLTAYLSIAIGIDQANHFVDLSLCQILSDGAHDLLQLVGRDVSALVGIKDIEGRPAFSFYVGLGRLSSHHGDELREAYRSVAVGVYFADYILQFGRAWVLSERSHYSAEFFDCDVPCAYRCWLVFWLWLRNSLPYFDV